MLFVYHAIFNEGSSLFKKKKIKALRVQKSYQ